MTMLIFLLIFAAIWLLSWGCLSFVRVFDHNGQSGTRVRANIFLLVLTALAALLVCMKQDNLFVLNRPELILAAHYLVFAVYWDISTHEIYDFDAYLVGGAGILWLLCKHPSMELLIELAIFAILQIILFSRMYEKGDVLAWIVCAIYITISGHGLYIYLLHMLSAVALLAIVALFQRNINRQGNLRRPVAFLPYIASTVWFFL